MAETDKQKHIIGGICKITIKWHFILFVEILCVSKTKETHWLLSEFKTSLNFKLLHNFFIHSHRRNLKTKHKAVLKKSTENCAK